ncbi:MAG TPA: CaiB/BaiF CoA-transferase family protein, partial [bacterium]
INYISIAGMLGSIGWADTPPAIPLNVIADFAGGGMHAAMAILAAIIARGTTGRGQHVDVAMTDGVLYLMATWVRTALAGDGAPKPGQTILNGRLPQYNVYQAQDGGWISLGALETKFWENLCRVMECEQWAKKPFDPATVTAAKAHFTARFKTKPRDEWIKILTQVEICAAPVYTLDEALEDPHNRAREMVATVTHPNLGKIRQVGVGPKFSDTPGSFRTLPPAEGEHTDAVLKGIGYSAGDIADLRAAKVIG